MKAMNAAKAAGTVVLSLFLLTSCFTFPRDDRESGSRESTTSEAPDNTAVILPPAEAGANGEQASRIADGAIKDAIICLRTRPAGNVSSGAPEEKSRRDRLSESAKGIYDMLCSAVEKIGGYEWDSAGYGGEGDAFSDFMAADEALRADHPRFRAYYYPDVASPIGWRFLMLSAGASLTVCRTGCPISGNTAILPPR